MKYQIQNVSIRNIWIACVCKINDVKKYSFCCWFQFLFTRTGGYDGEIRYIWYTIILG